MHILRIIRAVNSDYFSKHFSEVVTGMHIAYSKVGIEILNIWYNKFYIQSLNK